MIKLKNYKQNMFRTKFNERCSQFKIINKTFLDQIQRKLLTLKNYRLNIASPTVQ